MPENVYLLNHVQSKVVHAVRGFHASVRSSCGVSSVVDVSFCLIHIQQMLNSDQTWGSTSA